jgi:hypothetical protein
MILKLLCIWLVFYSKWQDVSTVLQVAELFSLAISEYL